MNGKTDWTVVFTSANQAELRQVARDPRPLEADEVAGPTVATLISAGTELAMYQGYLKDWPFPLDAGYAACFRAEQVGAEVTDVKVGDLCFTPGNHCTYLRRKRIDMLPAPAGLGAVQVCFARIMAVTMATLSTTTARPPGKVGVTGLGVVGNMAAQMFQSCGYDVYAVDPSEARRGHASAAGIRRVFASLADAPGAVDELDLVLECSGHERAALDAIKAVRKRGEVVLVGTPWKQNTDLTARDVLHAIFHRWPIVRSGWEWEMAPRPTDFRINNTWGNYQGALRWLAEGRIRTEGLYELVRPDDPQKVYQDLLAGRTSRLVTVFDWEQAR